MTFTDIYTVPDGVSDSSNDHVQLSRTVFILIAIVIIAVIIFIIREFHTPPKIDTEPSNTIINTPTNANVNTLDSIKSDSTESDSTKTDTKSDEADNSTPGRSPFTNDLPYQLKNESVKLNPDIDYSEMLKTMSLDQDVIKQHNQYVNDRNKITSTASFAPSRSDNQDIVTTWGLSKPKYINIDPSARNVPSQDPEQGSKPITLQWK